MCSYSCPFLDRYSNRLASVDGKTREYGVKEAETLTSYLFVKGILRGRRGIHTRQRVAYLRTIYGGTTMLVHDSAVDLSNEKDERTSARSSFHCHTSARWRYHPCRVSPSHQQLYRWICLPAAGSGHRILLGILGSYRSFHPFSPLPRLFLHRADLRLLHGGST